MHCRKIDYEFFTPRRSIIIAAFEFLFRGNLRGVWFSHVRKKIPTRLFLDVLKAFLSILVISMKMI